MILPKRASAVISTAESLRYRGLIILYLVIERPVVFDHCFVFFSTRNTTFKRITEFRHFSPQMISKNCTSLAVEICLNPEHEMWGFTDKQIFETVVAEMQPLGIVAREEVREYFSVRIPSAYPVYFLNYDEPLKVVLNDIARLKNLVSIGRQGLYQHDDMPTAIKSGLELTEIIEKHGGESLGKVNDIIYEKRLQKCSTLGEKKRRFVFV